MSEKETQNSKGISPALKSGEEPTELLLALAWSPIETLKSRGLVRVFVNKADGKVAILIENCAFLDGVGLVPSEKSVGNGES